MRLRPVFRAAVSAASPFCLFAAAAISAPTLAETPTGLTATTMLASVTTPTLTSDPAVLIVDEDRFATPVDADQAPDQSDRAPDPATLPALVERNRASDTIDAEHECLAVSVYFEAKGEPLAGQLAVAQTMLNRVGSGRFPASLCGVLHQHGQFSFIRGAGLPAVPRASAAWREAVAIARVARDGLWKDVAPAALFFHASRVEPNWRLTRVARLGNHVFYR